VAGGHDAELVKQWWGIAPRDQFVVCDIDLRVGGSWRYVFRDEQGNEDGFSGQFLELDPPHRAVQTERYEPMPGAEHTVTVTYEDNGRGGTRLSSLHRYASQEMRDGHIASGMEYGMNLTYDHLDDVLPTL
jgi:uncharacterized protein YndB with AHSA1/START domain